MTHEGSIRAVSVKNANRHILPAHNQRLVRPDTRLFGVSGSMWW